MCTTKSELLMLPLGMIPYIKDIPLFTIDNVLLFVTYINDIVYVRIERLDTRQHIAVLLFYNDKIVGSNYKNCYFYGKNPIIYSVYRDLMNGIFDVVNADIFSIKNVAIREVNPKRQIWFYLS